MKKCNKYGILKAYSKFNKHPLSKDGYQSICKKCQDKNSKKYKRTKEGLITYIYAMQKTNSKTREHNPPTYTKEWLESWLLNNPEFHRLYDIWVLSGYKKDFKPSVDRIDDNIGYTEYNIQLMTFRENQIKYANEVRKGEEKHKGLFNGGHKTVLQFDKQGNFIAEYVSINEASRQTGDSIANIHRVCNGKQKHSKGYIWKYKEN